MDSDIARDAQEIAARAERELEALVAISSPSGDVGAAEDALALCAALLPVEATVERPACSSPGHAPDLIGRVQGTGERRVLLLGHIDTVISHADHRPVERDGDKLIGSGTMDMKGGDILALGVLRTLARRPDRFAELAILLVCDEEWRTVPFLHGDAFADWDACLCFEAGEHTASGDDAVVVRRKAAGTLSVQAHGRASHSGAAPDAGRNALLALAELARRIAALHDPHGPDHLSAVPTIMHSGDAFNVVPAFGEMYGDLRADTLEAIERAAATLPDEHDGVRLVHDTVRLWPGMDSTAAITPVLEHAGATLGRPVVGVPRGGASDASHFAAAGIPLTVDGLGPRGGLAHHPDEFAVLSSLRERAEVALAIADAVLSRPGPPAPGR